MSERVQVMKDSHGSRSQEVPDAMEFDHIDDTPILNLPVQLGVVIDQRSPRLR